MLGVGCDVYRATKAHSYFIMNLLTSLRRTVHLGNQDAPSSNFTVGQGAE